MTETITQEQYAANVNARSSKQFHTDKVPYMMFHETMGQLYQVSRQIEAIKKALFYGRTDQYTSDPVTAMKYQQWKDEEAAEAQALGRDTCWPQLNERDSEFIHGLLGLAGEYHELLIAHSGRINELVIASGLATPEEVAAGGGLVQFDRTNAIEELGDMRWYYTLMLNSLGTTDDEVRTVNDAKLEKRYPLGEGGFSQEREQNRDLDGERAVLAGTDKEG
jgi:hypothetical protein